MIINPHNGSLRCKYYSNHTSGRDWSNGLNPDLADSHCYHGADIHIASTALHILTQSSYQPHHVGTIIVPIYRFWTASDRTWTIHAIFGFYI